MERLTKTINRKIPTFTFQTNFAIPRNLTNEFSKPVRQNYLPYNFYLPYCVRKINNHHTFFDVNLILIKFMFHMNAIMNLLFAL